MRRPVADRAGVWFIVVVGLALVAGQAPAGVFTAAQAAPGASRVSGELRVAATCRILRGRNEASPLAGPNFMNTWRGRTSRELFEFISSSMPPGGATSRPKPIVAITALHPAGQRRGGRRAAAEPRRPPLRSAPSRAVRRPIRRRRRYAAGTARLRRARGPAATATRLAPARPGRRFRRHAGSPSAAKSGTIGR